MIRTRGLTHLALKVNDAERAFAFYRDVFGVGSGSIAHFGFRLVDPRDIDEAARAVESAGGQVVKRGEFVPGEPYLFCRDPDGYDLEIWYELPTTADPQT